MRTLILATNNKNKIREMKKVLEGMDLEVLGQREALGEDLEVDEIGETLYENAVLKARGVFEKIKDAYVLADDTGLFVESLNGAPGVHSARYGGIAHDDERNKRKLLKELEKFSNRKAYFETVLVLMTPDDEEILLRGRCDGVITTKEEGENGFGYDPIFLPEEGTVTFANMTEDEKNKISHRGRAMRSLKDWFMKN